MDGTSILAMCVWNIGRFREAGDLAVLAATTPWINNMYLWTTGELCALVKRKTRIGNVCRHLQGQMRFARKSWRKLDNGSWRLMYSGGCTTKRVLQELERRIRASATSSGQPGSSQGSTRQPLSRSTRGASSSQDSPPWYVGFNSTDVRSLAHARGRRARVSLFPGIIVRAWELDVAARLAAQRRQE